MHAHTAAQADSRRDRWWALGLSLAALALYVATLAPSVATVFDDSLEFQVVLPSLGIAHPTGYPLYTLLGWLASRLPVGDLAYRVNLLSALAGAATVGVLFLVARRLGSSRLPAVLMSIVFALSTIWWSQATIAEVYTLHGLAVALILYLTLSDRGTRTPWLALVFGLALAHHRTTLLLAPGVGVYLLWSDPGVLRRPRDLAMLALAFLLPLGIYLYLPLRGQSVASLDGATIDTWASFVNHVLASDYNAFLSANPLAIQRPASYPLRLLLSQMGLAALLLGLLGWLRWPRQPKQWTLLALVLAANLVFAIGFKTADVDVFYIPVVMVWLLIAAAGLSWLLERLAAWLDSLDLRSGQAWQIMLTALLTVAVLLQPLMTTMRVLGSATRPQTCAEVLAVGETPAFTPQRRDAWNALNCGLAMLDQALPAESAIIGLQGEITLLRYLQMDRGLRPDVRLLDVDREDERLAAVEAELAAGRSVFVTRELPGLAERYSLSAAGPLVQVWPAGSAAASPLAETLDLPLGDALRLVGFDLSQVPATGAQWLRLSAAFAVDAPVGEALKVSARLLGPDGSVVASTDVVPVHWAYPTTAWRAGETVLDTYDFALPLDVDSAALTPLLILYRAADGAEVGRYQPTIAP
ncbi:MAG TPA: DUF2723 domain-containing protein [Anaerolineae bacterium]|nr:DUF2723 domain-containing protein [Anaerolineae bacterium]